MVKPLLFQVILNVIALDLNARLALQLSENNVVLLFQQN